MDFPPRPTRSACEMATPAENSSYSEVNIDQTSRLTAAGAGGYPGVGQMSGDRLTKSFNSDQLGPSIKQVRTHRRINSHEDVSFLRNFALEPNNVLATPSSSSERHSSTMSDKSSSRLSTSSSSISNRSEEDISPPRINESSPSDYFSRVSADANTDELPAGWQEVKDEGNETYYWHIWTGTIQYERPTVLMVCFFFVHSSIFNFNFYVSFSLSN